MQAWYHGENVYPFVPQEVLDRAPSVRASLPNKYCDPKIAADLFEECLDEHLLCDELGVNVVSIGSLTLAIVHPREVFKPLILMNAAAWICAHNHPSGGDPTPSPEDRVLTSRLRQGADLLGISLLDHLILTDEHCYSFADQGWPGA